jgi:maltose/moltooligosaccharide transporter
MARLGVHNTSPDGAIPDTVKFAFYAGGAVLLGAVGWTVASTREYPPEQLRAFATGTDDARPRSIEVEGAARAGLAWILAGVAGTALIAACRLQAEMYLLSAGLLAYGVALLWLAHTRSRGMLAQVLGDLRAMPEAMRRLAWLQLFSWFALFAMWIYATSAVAQVHFGSTDPHSLAYNEGANWVGVLFAAYNGFAALAALVIPSMVRWWGLRASHLVNLWLGGAGLLSFLVIRDPHWLLLPMVGVGFAWASILSLPYAMLSDHLPPAKMGVYMGIFNFFIVIPQLVAASVLGQLLKVFFHGQPIWALALGGVSLLVAGMCTLRVQRVVDCAPTPA